MTRARFTLVALFLLAAGPVFAQGNVAGDWDVTITSPQGPNTMQVTFRQDGDKVSGVLKSQMGELPFEGGTLAGTDLTFMFAVPIQGQSLEITLTGKVDGEAIAGKAQFGGFGEGEWTARRSVASAPAVAPAAAVAEPAPAAVASVASVGAAGRWEILLKTPAGDFPATATLTDAAGTLSGTFGSQMGEVPVTGSVDGRALKLALTAQTPQGEMTVVMTGELDGDVIVNGMADVSGLGQMEWSAKRAKQ